MGDVFSGIGKVVAAPFTAATSFIDNALGFGKKQQTSSSSALNQQSFAQFPDLQKAIAQFGFGNVQSLADPLSARLNEPTPGQSVLDQITARSTTPFAFPQLTDTGLYPQQQQAFHTAIQQALGSVSSNYAQRGFLRPENINAIAGAAAQNVAPQFASLIGQNVQQAAMAPEQVAQQRQAMGLTAALTPEQVTQNRINQLLQLISTYPGLLGGIGTQVSAGQTNFPSFFQSILPAIAQGGAQGIASKTF